MDCRVVVEAAIPVYDVGSADEAVRIAIAKTGKMLNPDLSYVDIEIGSRTSPSGEELPPAFVAADEALVALELGMTVYNVEGEEHASRVARKEIGGRLDGVPLKVLDRSRIDGQNEESAEDDENTADETTNDESDDTAANTNAADDTDDLLPEFEEMVDEHGR